MVPVGGAIVTSPDPNFIIQISKQYPGRANMSPILDLFITLLSMGEDGLINLWKERRRLFVLMREKLTVFCASRGESLLISPNNSISIGVTLGTLTGPLQGRDNDEANGEKTVGDSLHAVDSCGIDQEQKPDNLAGESGELNDSELRIMSHQSSENPQEAQSISEMTAVDCDRNIGPITGSHKSSPVTAESVSFLGSMLFQRNVSGCRVVEQSDTVTEINGVEFISWGSHVANYPVSYFTAACSVGLTEGEILLFIDRLQKTWKKYENLKCKSNPT